MMQVSDRYVREKMEGGRDVRLERERFRESWRERTLAQM